MKAATDERIEAWKRPLAEGDWKGATGYFVDVLIARVEEEKQNVVRSVAGWRINLATAAKEIEARDALLEEALPYVRAFPPIPSYEVDRENLADRIKGVLDG